MSIKYSIKKWLGFILISHFVLLTVDNSMAQGRIKQAFNDGWEFALSDLDIKELQDADVHWKSISIPHTWNNKDVQSGEKVNYTTAWYKKIFFTVNKLKDKEYFLRFEGVGQYAALYVNNKFVGDHLGGYSAFVFKLNDFLLADTVNTIYVKVNNELQDSYPKDNFLFGIFGGIYRDVSLIITDHIHIGLTDHASSGVYIHPKEVSKEKAILKIETLLKNEGSEKQLLTVENRLLNSDSEVIAACSQQELLYPGGLISSFSLLDVDNPRLWNAKKDPYLYQLETLIIVDGTVTDQLIQDYGIRYFSIDPEEGFILNGNPYRLYGVCRHQEWEDLGNALLAEHHRIDMRLIDELGATTIRLAHYQQADYIYDLADSLGILIWAEIPFVNGYKEGADGNALQQMTELIKQNFNHPAIFVWGVHNEVIKGDVVQPAVNLTAELHNLSKALDPHRYTVAVSNIWWVYDHPIHENTELQGFNQYTGWYGGKPEELRNWISNYHQKKPDIRFSVSEYGAGGNIAHQSGDITTDPDPKGQFFSEGYQTHYHEQTWDAIDESPYIWASYVWNMFDFSVPEWDRGGIKGRNHKGLITYDRKTKKDAFYWYKANWSKEAVLHLSGKRRNSISAGNIHFKAYCNYGIPSLYINGEYKGSMTAGINKIQYLSRDMTLEPGIYLIEVRAEHHAKGHSDSFTLVVE
ncbi:MAG: glycoside hydrolase family 2 TIM barrel-domain containing protein [Bacteroidota bacterium]